MVHLQFVQRVCSVSNESDFSLASSDKIAIHTHTHAQTKKQIKKQPSCRKEEIDEGGEGRWGNPDEEEEPR